MLDNRHNFSENICVLCFCMNIRRMNDAILHLFLDKVTINLNMFRALMKDRIRSKIEGSLIVTFQQSWGKSSKAKIFEKREKPNDLTSSSGNSSILGLRSGPCNNRLFLRPPGNW